MAKVMARRRTVRCEDALGFLADALRAPAKSKQREGLLHDAMMAYYFGLLNQHKFKDRGDRRGARMDGGASTSMMLQHSPGWSASLRTQARRNRASWQNWPSILDRCLTTTAPRKAPSGGLLSGTRIFVEINSLLFLQRLPAITVRIRIRVFKTRSGAMNSQSYTIDQWCALRKISRSMFYKLRGQGKAPRTHAAGAKQIIGPDADAEWLRDREAESQHASEAVRETEAA